MSPTTSFVFFVASFSTVYSGWIEDLKGGGLDLGDSGVKLFLDKNSDPGRSILDRYSLRMGYSGLGLSFGKKDSQLDVGIYYNDDNNKIEGRGKKMGELIIPLMVGLKASTIGSIMMAAVGGLVLQALMVSKLALLTSSVLVFYKFFGSKSKDGGHVKTSYHSLQPELSSVHYEKLQPDLFNHIAPSGYANYPSSLHASASNQAPQYAVLNPAAPINSTHQLISFSPQNFHLSRRRVDSKHSYNNEK